MRVVIEEHQGLVDGDLAHAWEELSASDPSSSVFQEPRYLRVWLDVLGGDTRARTLLVRRDDELIGVIAEGWNSDGVGRFLGGTDVTDYLGPVARPEDREAVAAAHLDHLAAGDAASFIAGGLGEDLGWAQVYRDAAAAAGFDLVEDVTEDVCPRVDLSGGSEGYLERLDGKDRQEQKRKVRKLAREVGDLHMAVATADDATQRLDQFFEMVAENEASKAGFFARDDHREFFRALAEEFVADGTFLLHVLEVGGIPAAATVTLVWKREWGLYNSAFDTTLADFAPGVVQIAMLVQEAADTGHDVFDLLRGDEAYKYRFGAEDRVITSLTLQRQ